jgi:transposase
MTRQSKRADQLRRIRHWQAHVTAQKQSGLSRAEYCRQHQLSYHAVTYWTRRLSTPTSQETTLVPVTFTSSIKINSAPTAGSVLKVILPNKIAVEVDDGFSPNTLTKLLSTLERR